MNPSTVSVAARIAMLPISPAERREALAYVAAGESIADAIVAVMGWFESSPSLKPALQD